MNEQLKIDIPAQEGRGFWVTKGQTFRVIDPEGQQVADLLGYFCRGWRERLAQYITDTRHN
ncbi:DUF1989 domain-containing protein [Citrobacter sp. RHBSTW-00671]|uniref:DUF1989 domain-containing protein n=1 Tax=Citrobacter sp. RHBSTW-00671 TaxID=2742660 RepID=UPI0017C8E3D8|nr:DUF1989 domain-containing protein [Citrobacter sp. RHBSTW-00671]MBA7966310.1 DUF1989 domain-containing protein [Citrobacter sp. RHBSTW-00671]